MKDLDKTTQIIFYNVFMYLLKHAHFNHENVIKMSGRLMYLEHEGE